MSKKIGIVGITGRMGQLLAEEVEKHEDYRLGIGLSRTSEHTLDDVCAETDFIVDFSGPLVLTGLLAAADKAKKPVILCSTGWKLEDFATEIDRLAQKVPVVIAPNTSGLVFLQNQLVKDAVNSIPHSHYDIDVAEKHHRNKKDSPSGTTLQLRKNIQHTLQEKGLKYSVAKPNESPRKENTIGLSVTRSGNLHGEHEVTFTGHYDQISIRHTTFDRRLFARGALLIVKRLDKTAPKAGLYSMYDVIRWAGDEDEAKRG